MTAVELEFQISQYVDGTLSPAEVAVVDSLLAVDPDARKILSHYRQLDAALLQSQSIPAIKWDKLATNLWAAVDHADVPLTAGKINTWQPRLRIAAALLIAGTAALVARHAIRSHQPNKPMAPTVTAVVSGPAAEVAAGSPVEEVSIGPSPALAMHGKDWRDGQGVVGRGPSKVVLLGALNPPVKPDSNRH